MMHRSTLALIGDRYLDTQHDADYIATVESELKRRGVTGIKRFVLEYISASSLWVNIILWEWEELDGKDVAFGWATNLVVYGATFLFFSYVFSVEVGLYGILATHIATTLLGLGARFGNKIRDKKT